MAGRHPARATQADPALVGLAACPDPDCTDFNRFAGGNLPVVEWTGLILGRWSEHGGGRGASFMGGSMQLPPSASS